ncbi:hypothetical protein CHS0354_039786 [Potamilus streckersoni]|uniref:XLF-like N-terminal domain-containing protein n=1 Tax=Potamilus streckersoni TaxID=2493646 RepID=A0AAE0RZP7_9BIVA|nr:hypothetical protein CHS0354_039786 [Potamilus streckersoni]
MTTETDWRRKWTSNLCASPWHPLEIQGSPYLVKWLFNEILCEIILTDFDSFWYEELSNNSFKERVEAR